MVKIIKRISIGALLLLILPLIFYVVGWEWHIEKDYYWLKIWYWFTKTVTLPWGILTNVLLISWFSWCLRYCLSLRLGLKLIVILSVILLIGQGIKLFIKEQIQEPRPYLVWLNKYYSFNDQAFCVLSDKANYTMLAIKLQQKQLIPLWLQRHWCTKNSFSFPSGHTLFSVSWALLAVCLLWPHQCWISTIVIMIWSSGVIVSRITLAMHWPRDIVMGIIVSWMLITLISWLAQDLFDILTSTQRNLNVSISK